MESDSLLRAVNVELDFTDEVVDDLCKIGAFNLEGNLSCKVCGRGFFTDVKLENLCIGLAYLSDINDYCNLASVVDLLEERVNRSNEVLGNGNNAVVADEVEDICKFFKERCNGLVADILNEACKSFKDGLNGGAFSFCLSEEFSFGLRSNSECLKERNDGCVVALATVDSDVGSLSFRIFKNDDLLSGEENSEDEVERSKEVADKSNNVVEVADVPVEVDFLNLCAVCRYRGKSIFLTVNGSLCETCRLVKVGVFLIICVFICVFILNFNNKLL